MPSLGHGHLKYWQAGVSMERVEIHRLIYDPKDLVEAPEHATPWSPEPTGLARAAESA